MKGKGKGDRGSTSRAQTYNTFEDKDVLQFPDLKPVDHSRQCPRYAAVLQRSDEDGIGLEEVDTLQSELETLLASAAKRMRLLEAEENNLVSRGDGQKSERRSESSTPTHTSSSTVGNKRSAGKDDKVNKRYKDSSGKGHSSTSGRGKGKAVGSTVKEKEHVGGDSPHPKELPRMPRNDVPNRFWSTIEPYCTDITNEDLKVLEDILKSHEDDVEYHKVPSLGKHYSKKWAQEDMLDEQKEGARITDKRTLQNQKDDKAEANKAAAAQQVEQMLKKAEESNDYGSPFGPLTQRLVCALIEENIMTPVDENTINETDLNAAEAVTMSPRLLAKQLNITNAASLERRIRRELEEQGILEEDTRPDDNPEDEILCELRKKQQELRQLTNHNLQVVKRLLKSAKDEMLRQDIRKKIIVADAEVMDAYRKIQASRAKKKVPSKKEKELTWRAIKERETLLKSLELV